MGHAFQQTLMDVAHPLPPHARRQRQLGGRAPTTRASPRRSSSSASSRKRASRATTSAARSFVKRVWAWKEAVRLHHHAPDAPPRRLVRLDSRHEGRRATSRWTRRCRARWSRSSCACYDEGLIYRGKRLVNWDPVLGTAVSDLEVDSEEEDGTLWQILAIRSRTASGSSLVVATTRPETMLGDMRGRGASRGRALPRTSSASRCDLPLVRPHHPDHRRRLRRPRFRHRLREDHAGARFQRLRGRHAPRAAADRRSSRSTRRSTTTARAYRGLDRFEARKACSRTSKRRTSRGSARSRTSCVLPRSERTGVVVEPMLTDQWFVKMDGMAKARPRGRRQAAR